MNTTTSCTKFAIPSGGEMVCCWVVTRGSISVWERGIFVLRDDMSKCEGWRGIEYRCIKFRGKSCRDAKNVYLRKLRKWGCWDRVRWWMGRRRHMNGWVNQCCGNTIGSFPNWWKIYFRKRLLGKWWIQYGIKVMKATNRWYIMNFRTVKRQA